MFDIIITFLVFDVSPICLHFVEQFDDKLQL